MGAGVQRTFCVRWLMGGLAGRPEPWAASHKPAPASLAPMFAGRQTAKARLLSLQ
ncbi:MAG: hypothetical protein AW11_00953 [Candidatus Accumulibacter regalis]|uniref:Uncharacterized protein n=1 Tax=Accumulibacter regalis TaxID=522306 RepID=A0A011QMH9_ACCRE|nr:MAG: hypothetical protein AW11_00953 [Candidatus Accumulibacter regalis]